MATTEEQALAAINAAEAMAISNIQLIKQLKSILPKSFGSVAVAALPIVEQQFRMTADAERAIVRGVGKVARSRKQKANDKKKSKAWAQANSEGRKNNGDFRAGWNQKRVATRANKILKKL